MLKVDPKRRITVSGLVTHPWLMKGVEVPVEWHSKYKVHFIYGPCHDKFCLREFRHSEAQTSLLSYRDKLENWNFACSKSRYDIF